MHENVLLIILLEKNVIRWHSASPIQRSNLANESIVVFVVKRLRSCLSLNQIMMGSRALLLLLLDKDSISYPHSDDSNLWYVMGF